LVPDLLFPAIEDDFLRRLCVCMLIYYISISLYQFSILYLRHLVIQYPKQKITVTHATVAIIITTAIGRFIIYYLYVIFSTLHYDNMELINIKNYIYIYCI
jgi:hypothetical protein